MTSPAIEVHDLVKTYPGGVRALDRASFDAPAGHIFALLGPNGAGKTTAVRILTTLSRPDSGSVLVGGFDVVREAGRVRATIGVVAQRSGFDPTATGRENLLLQGRLFGLGGRDLRRRCDDLLQLFGLSDAANRLASTYSGGMTRRLDICLGLVHRPRLLFLDEPTTGLDPEVRVALWDEVRRLAQDDGLTILLTTHYLEEADRLAAQIAILDRGRVVAQGSPEVLKSELRGDAIGVELREPAPEPVVRDALGGLAGIGEIRLDDRIVHLRVPSGASALPGVLAALDARGVPVASATVARPSLDDVYLRYAGRSFAAADRSAERNVDRTTSQDGQAAVTQEVSR
jgi:ABC-2 type transport system ATP-binding protein